MNVQSDFHVGGFVFFSGFDSGNLGKVELVEPEPEESPQDSSNLNLDENLENLLPEKSNSEDRHFKMWTRPDCQVIKPSLNLN